LFPLRAAAAAAVSVADVVGSAVVCGDGGTASTAWISAAAVASTCPILYTLSLLLYQGIATADAFTVADGSFNVDNNG
jgi:hypothetical protein